MTEWLGAGGVFSRRRIVWPLWLVLSGCAAYHAKPLPAASQVSANQWAALTVAARHVRSPLLPPVRVAPKPPYSPDEIALLAVAGNPGLRAERDQLGLAQAQVLNARLLPDPVLSAGIANALGGGGGSVIGYSLGLSEDLGALLARGPREKAARAARRSVELRVAWREWQVACESEQQALDLRVLTRAARAARGFATHARAFSRVVATAYAAGAVDASTAAAAEGSAAGAKVAALDLRQRRDAARERLDQLLGLSPGTVVAVAPGTLARFSHLPTAQALIAGLSDRRLDLLALRAGYRSADADLRGQILAQFPVIGIGFTRARDTTGVNTAGPDVTLALPLFNHNAAGVAKARARRRMLYEEYQARILSARSDITRARSALQASVAEVRSARRQSAAGLRLARAARVAYRHHAMDGFSYFALANEGMQALHAATSLELREIRLGIALELASGRYLPGPAR